MKILFLPEVTGEDTSGRSPEIVKILGRKHELVFLNPKENWIRSRRFWPLRAWERIQITRNLIEAGKKMRGIDLIFCKDYMYALPGIFIAKHLNKPCVWESEGSMKAFWDASHKYPFQVLHWMWMEKWLVKYADHMITVTETDAKAYIQQGMNPDRIDIVPVCIRPENASKKTRTEARQLLGLPQNETLFLFFSMFNYAPNFAALDFLNKSVAPHLPGRLLLCGSGKLPKKLHPKIEYLGFVPLERLYDLIRASDVCLAPVWEANGTLVKVLDMLAHGAPTVVTSAVQQGIPELQDGVHTLIAKTKEEFLQKTLQLANNANLRQKFTQTAPEIIEKKYNWNLHEEKLLALMESYLPTR